MLKSSRSLALAVQMLVLVGCSTGSTPPPVPAESKLAIPQSGADPGAPGMIPGECEALLNKSQEWNYLPGQKWKPESLAQALEVAHFFAHFRLVPAPTSEFYRQLQDQGAQLSGLEAQKTMTQATQAQACDGFLAQDFLESLVAYSWPRAEKAEASAQLLRFFLNQQALHLPLLHRALAARALGKAATRGLVPVSSAKARELVAWLDREMTRLPAGQENAPAPEALAALRQELSLSGEIRERLSRLLPLP